MLKEAGAVLTESEKPLGYAATLVTILGVATVLAYVLTLAGVRETEAVAFGLLSALLGLSLFVTTQLSGAPEGDPNAG